MKRLLTLPFAVIAACALSATVSGCDELDLPLSDSGMFNTTTCTGLWQCVDDICECLDGTPCGGPETCDLECDAC